MAFPVVTEGNQVAAPVDPSTPQMVPDSVFNSTVFGSGEVLEDPFAAAPASGTDYPQIPSYPQAPQYPPAPLEPQPAAPVQQPVAPQLQLPPDVQAQLEQARQILPLAQFIRENPDIAQAIERKLSGAQPQAASAPAPSAPEAPARPASYNPSDAVQNPESDSWKYREAYEKYQADTLDYVRGELKRRDAADAEVQQRAETQRAQQVRLRQIASEAQAQHGLTQDQAVDFVKTMSDPRSITTANLVQLYRIQRGLPITNVQRPQQAPNIPQPPVNGGGTTPATAITENWFDSAAREWVRKPGQ